MAEKEQESFTTTNAVFTLWGLCGATVLVAATTMDDAIWLIPYICSQTRFTSWQVRFLHMLTFVATLVCLAILCCIAANSLAALLVQRRNDDESEEYWYDDDDIFLGAIGALLCWIIAVTLYVKKLLKKKKRQQEQQQKDQEKQQSCSKTQSQEKGDYGTIVVATEENDLQQAAEAVNSDNHHGDEASSLSSRVNNDNNNTGFDPWTVMSLTFVGALDEISYFPALLLGHVFTSSELILGTALAACLICCIISTTFLLAPCRPIMACLDTIPLYAIVTVFAVVLTIGVVIDVLHDKR